MMNELTCEKAGNLFQVETIHRGGGGGGGGDVTSTRQNN